MDETQDETVTCSICGDALQPEQHDNALCAECTDAWAREIESPW